MSIRREPTYLSTDVWRALWLLSKAQEKTPDELADEMLHTIITEKYPQLFEHQQQVDKMQQKLIETLGEQL